MAIDLHAGEIAWRVPFRRRQPRGARDPLLLGVELPERLGTRGTPARWLPGEAWCSSVGAEPYLYAFDKATGAEI